MFAIIQLFQDNYFPHTLPDVQFFYWNLENKIKIADKHFVTHTLHVAVRLMSREVSATWHTHANEVTHVRAFFSICQ